MKSGILAVVGLFLLATADTPQEEVARHQGVWNAESFTRDGEKTPEEIVKTITRTAEAGHIVWKRNGKAFAGTTMILDTSADPKTIDILPDGGPAQDKKVLGIYKIEGDVLTICMADADVPRPKAFSAEKGSRTTLMTFRKAAKVKAES